MKLLSSFQLATLFTKQRCTFRLGDFGIWNGIRCTFRLGDFGMITFNIHSKVLLGSGVIA